MSYFTGYLTYQDLSGSGCYDERQRVINKGELSMRRTIVIAVLVLTTASIALGQRPSASGDRRGIIEQVIRQLDHERIQAQIDADAAALQRIYAADFIGVGPSGTVRTKPQVISDFTSGKECGRRESQRDLHGELDQWSCRHSSVRRIPERGPMSRLKPDTAFRRILEDSRLPARARIMALEQIAQPSLNLLSRLLSQRTTPPRLRLLAASK